MKSSPQPDRPRAARPAGNLVFLAVLAIAILIVYFPAIHGGIIWDDDIYLTAHRPITDPWGLFKIWFDPVASVSPYPLVFTTYWIEHRLWGFRTEGYHLVNLVIHALNALLVSIVLRRMGFRHARLAALIFAIHPMNVESAAWITERKDLLSGFFYLLAVILWMRHLSEGGRRFHAGSAVCFVLAMLSKTVTCTFPVFALFLAVWRADRLSVIELRRLAVKTAPMFLIALLLGLATVWWESHKLVGERIELNFIQRILIAGRAPWFYLAKLAWPWPLTFIYQKWPLAPGSPFEWTFPLGAFGLSVLLIAFNMKRRGAPGLAAGYYLITLAPALGFLNYTTMVFGYAYNHYQYLAGIALASGSAWILASVAARTGIPQLRAALLAAILVALGLTSRNQASHFISNETLFRANIRVNPNSYAGHYNVGVELDAQGKPEAAIQFYDEAIRLNPAHVDSYCNRGNSLMAMGRLGEAQAEFDRALRLDPKDYSTHLSLGLLARRENRLDEAVEWFIRAAAINPENSKAPNNLGTALMDAGRVEEAVAAFETARKLDPDNPRVINNLAVALMQAGRREEAIKWLRRALEITPDDPLARARLDQALSIRAAN